jgi:hypothetical protein
METTEFSETSVNKNLTPGNYPKESNLHVQHGESLKTVFCRRLFSLINYMFIYICNESQLDNQINHKCIKWNI